ncbi:MAG TPA: hypothetical protein VK508_18930 [Cyclobacteriaceae bacterium]|nr:hypothetical protein [Cyclobacteriaceae bacterium]
MKKAILLFVLLAISTFSFAQRKSKKLTVDESAKMTADQRYVHESTRKSKSGKKDLSLKKKIRTEKKQDQKARKMKGNRRKSY